MKKFILSLVLLASFAAAPAFAEIRQCKDSTICKAQCEFAALNLSDSQMVKIKEINDNYGRQNRDLFKKGGADQRQNRDSIRDAVRNQAKELRRSKLKDIKAVLSQDQYIQFLENNYVNTPAKGPKIDKKGMRPGNKSKMMKREFTKGERPSKAQFDNSARPDKANADKKSKK